MTLVLHRTPTPAAYRFVAGVLRPMMRGLSRYEVSGLEHVPDGGGFIVTPNHVSHIDPFPWTHVLYNRGIAPVFLAKSALFDAPLIGTMMRHAKQVRVDRESATAAEALAPAIRALEAELEQLHERDYVLVDPHDIAAVGSDGKMRYQELKLPKGKKPLVLSVDDVNYYEYMQEDGFADRLVLDDGRVRTEYTDTSGKTETGAHDVVPILDDFVDKNPDFSHGGAKGILALTGYEGSLGYDTSRRAGASGAKLTKEQAKAKKVADALKKGGWTFASHTWGHITMTDASLERVKKDQSSWAAEVEPITGPTDLLAYPFGADISTTEPYAGPVYDYLAGEGYDYFFNVDGSGPWQQLEGGYLRQGRINLDGILLRQHLAGKASSLKPYIDVDDTVDDARKR